MICCGLQTFADFVVETEDIIYLVKVKTSNELNDPEVLAKQERGV